MARGDGPVQRDDPGRGGCVVGLDREAVRQAMGSLVSLRVYPKLHGEERVGCPLKRLSRTQIGSRRGVRETWSKDLKKHEWKGKKRRRG